MVELVTFLAGLNKSSLRSLSAIPLLSITFNPFCTFAAILHCLEVTVNFGGKTLHAIIFERFFPIKAKQKRRLPASLFRIIWGELVEIFKTWLDRALESLT